MAPLHALLSMLVLTTLFGCAKQSRTSVSGNVTLDGQPIASGQIVFEPTSGGRLGIAPIADGKYIMPAAQGPTAGKYVVRITANRPSGRKVQAGRGDKALVDQYEQYIPAKYNEQSELTTEVGSEGEIVRDFGLKSK
jgi:hypothetical protein